MNEEQQPNMNQVTILNKALNNYNLLQLRLDPSNLINEIKMYLKAEIEVVTQQEDGTLNRKVMPVGLPKANEAGIASILNWIQMTVNPHVVQGNFPSDRSGRSEQYEHYIERFQKDLGDMIYIKLYDYAIDENEAQSIIDAIMNLIVPFMTRLIDNKERESYGETFKETFNSQPSKGGFKLFKG